MEYNNTVKTVQGNYSVENWAFEKLCKHKGLDITFEYTTPGTPHLNGYLEQKFATLYGKLWTMMKVLGIKTIKQKRFWAEAEM